MIPRVPRIIDYNVVLQQLTDAGWTSLYHNSGAFGFSAAEKDLVRTIAWIGPPDPTIRDAARPYVRQAEAPFAESLSRAAARAWQIIRSHTSAETAWILPKSHWHYELQFGSVKWMPDLLQSIGIDASALSDRNNGSAIAFDASEGDLLQRLLQGLLENLSGSDFALMFPARPVVCSVHHHVQLWWQTTDQEIYAMLDRSLHVAPE
jgi:hypothetical protein